MASFQVSRTLVRHSCQDTTDWFTMDPSTRLAPIFPVRVQSILSADSVVDMTLDVRAKGAFVFLLTVFRDVNRWESIVVEILHYRVTYPFITDTVILGMQVGPSTIGFDFVIRVVTG